MIEEKKAIGIKVKRLHMKMVTFNSKYNLLITYWPSSGNIEKREKENKRGKMEGREREWE